MFSSVPIFAAEAKVADVTEYEVVTEHMMLWYDGIENYFGNVTTYTMHVDPVYDY